MIPSQWPSINSWSADYLDQQYRSWKKDRNSVDPQWDIFFQGFELGYQGGGEATASHQSNGASTTSTFDDEYLSKHSRVTSLVYHYRDIGHLMAEIDPLEVPRPKPELLQLEAFQLTEDDLDSSFHTAVMGFEGRQPLREIINTLEQVYCGHLGVEYMHIQDTRMRRWLQNRIEPCRSCWDFSTEEKKTFLRKLHQSELFEQFLQNRYTGQKRFSLEGGETLIPMLYFGLQEFADAGGKESVIGMAHRGRLNVLANILQKGFDDIFAEFEDNYEDMTDGGGDVKYHKGYSTTLLLDDDKELYLTLAANPSHLEAVDPVVMGRCRAKQRQRGDKERKEVVPILIHGDAAFCGQGMVAEIFQLETLPGYTTGGTIHIIVNNQIGFTTDPEDARSSTYCTDVAKTIQAPIFHANGDDPEACAFAMRMAVAYRQEFGEDVVVDMWCYRKHGHNESDEPGFTQPEMYRRIRQKKSIGKIYSEKLLKEGVIEEKDIETMQEDMKQILDEAQAHGKENAVEVNQQGFRKNWYGYGQEFSFDPVDTTISKENVLFYADRLSAMPKGFKPHRKVARLYEKRKKTVHENEGMDWGTVEALAYASLLHESIPVRLSGQDSRRGTFSHRHSVLTDTETGETYKPLDHLVEGQPTFCVYDSPLSEVSVVGFEYGYSLGDPNMLIIWEAQFGDFANGAQVIIDQFISCAEIKWDRGSGLVLLLPHGYEGQGPEHSSARLERFLQLCANDNMQVANLTTPAQYFHIMRRQMKRKFRKPLIIMSPKSLLRHPRATSKVEDLTDGGFQELIDDSAVSDASVIKRIIFCSGKIYYDLMARQEEVKRKDTAVIRVEQLYPLHKEKVQELLDRYSNAEEHLWVQEEPQNMGAWNHIAYNMVQFFGIWPKYVGRRPSATPAVGSHAAHEKEQHDIMAAALPANERQKASV